MILFIVGSLLLSFRDAFQEFLAFNHIIVAA